MEKSLPQVITRYWGFQKIPATHAQALRRAFTTPPSYHEIAKANHNDIMTKQQAVSLFYDFFN